MHKWKRGCLKKKSIKTQILNDSGITLVELLAALSLLSIVILLAGSIHMFGQRQYKDQKDSAEVANDLGYALNVMTTDIRKQSMNEIEIVGSTENNINYNATQIIINDPAGKVIYALDKTAAELTRNGVVIAKPVNTMLIDYEGTNIGLNITLASTLNNSKQKEYQTTITFRRLTQDGTQKK